MTPRRTASPRNADFVLEGGGVKGIALVGALAAFEEAGYVPNRVAGTSAGADVASLFAARVPAKEQHDLLIATPFKQFIDPTFWERLPIPLLNTALSEILDKGEYRGRALEQFFGSVLARHGVRSFGDLRLDDPGLDPSVPADERYRLVVVTADVTRGIEAHLPWDYRSHYGLDPDRQSVAEAVHMSSAIPFFFVPVPLRSALTGETSLMVDGGVTNGFPVGIFDRTDGRPPRWPTFAISLESRVAPDHKVGEVGGVIDFGKRLITTLLEGRNREAVEQPAELRRTVFIDTSDVDATDFDIDARTAEMLYQRGYRAAQQFLRTFSFAQYLRDASARDALRRGMTAPAARQPRRSSGGPDLSR